MYSIVDVQEVGNIAQMCQIVLMVAKANAFVYVLYISTWLQG